MKKIISRSIFSILGLLIAGWLYAFNGHFLPQKLEFKQLKKIEFLSLVDSLIEVKITAEFCNHNRLGGTVKELNLDLFFTEKNIGKIKEHQNWKIKASSTTQLTLTSKLNLAQVADVFPDMMAADSVILNMKGFARAQILFTTIKLPVDVTELFSLKKEIEHIISKSMNEQNLIIHDIPVPKFSLSRTDVKAKIKLKNSYNIPYELRKINFQLYLKGEDKPFGDISSNNSVTLKARGEEVLPMNFSIKNQELFFQMGRFALGEKQINAKGSMKIFLGGYSFKIPIRRKINFKF